MKQIKPKILIKTNWSGNSNKKKLVTVAWEKVCAPYEEGGLGLRSLVCINEATNMKLCRELLNSKEDWAIIHKSRALRNGHSINHHIASSIWSGVKTELTNIMDNSIWRVGSGHQIHLWNDA
jgi:hypothetical protein